MWEIPLFDISFDEKEQKAALDVIRSGWFTMGKVTQRFEELFAEAIGVKHAIAVSSGTAALHLSKVATGISEGDEVICPSLTFVAGANTIIRSGARPVFADITSTNDLNISPEDIESKMTDRTKAIDIVHYAGYPCDMSSILKIARKYQLPVIEDCAHAPGASLGSEKCGAQGTIGCFSFFSNKNMTTGEGGMLTTNDDELAQKIRLMRSHGMTNLTLDRHRGHAFSYDVVELGYNYRIDEIRSAIGIVQLQKLAEYNQRRRELANIYRSQLSRQLKITLPFSDHSGTPSNHILPILLDKDINRLEFMTHLKQKGIQTSIHYPPTHLFEFYQSNLGYANTVLPITEDVAAREVTLPLYPALSEEKVHYVCQAVSDYLKAQEVQR
jgi:dTDP-4-amino-4,6-dideoxygalactose transaminase